MKLKFIKVLFFTLWCLGPSKFIFRASTVGLRGGNKKVSSYSSSISGLFSGKGGKGGMSLNKGVLRSLHLWSNSSSLFLSGALRLLYLGSNSSSLLSFDSVIGSVRLLSLRHNSSLPSLLSSSSSSLLSILLFNWSSLAWSSWSLI